MHTRSAAPDTARKSVSGRLTWLQKNIELQLEREWVTVRQKGQERGGRHPFAVPHFSNNLARHRSRPGDPSRRRDPRPRYTEIAAETSSRPPAAVPRKPQPKIDLNSRATKRGKRRPPARAALIVRQNASAQRHRLHPSHPCPPRDPFRTAAFSSPAAPDAVRRT